MRSASAPALRALPLLLALSAPGAFASEPATADVATLIQQLQERLARLESRNAELEKRLQDPAQVKAIQTRLDEVETEVLTLSRKPDPLEKFAGISAAASLTMVAQHASRGDVDNGQLNARADIEVELPMGSIGDAEGKLFAHFRAGDGSGVDVGAFATPNAVVFDQSASPVLMQAWYQLDIPVGAAGGDPGRVELTVGKIDPFGFFDGNNVADDESEQFLNLAFIHNPLLDAGGDIGAGTYGSSPGLRLAYVSDVNGGNNVSAAIGLFGAGPGADFADSFDRGLVIGQLEYAGKTWGGLTGAYRLYAWSNGNAADLGDSTERHAGWGISLDQQIAEHVTLFSRLGFSTKGEVAVDRAYTLGAQFDGGLWGRADDRIGLALGHMEASRESGLGGAEKPLELYYAWQVNDHLQISPSVQWIRDPGADSAARDVTVWGLRAKASY